MMNRKPECKIRLECVWINTFAPVPEGVHVNPIIKGPFKNNILMKTTPYIEEHPIPRKTNKQKHVVLKTGIPDPWSEYVLHKYLQASGMSNNKMDISLKRKQHLEITEDLVNKHHLTFLQGIPDPWKNWPSYSEHHIRTEKKPFEETD